MIVNRPINNGASKGMTLIEMLVVLAIFSIVMAGLYSAYSVLTRTGIKEYKLAQTDMELVIGTSIIDRDLAMSGHGITMSNDMKKYCGGVQPSQVSKSLCPSGLQCTDLGFCVPIAVSASDGGSTDPDTITMMGIAIGRASRAAMGWSFIHPDDELVYAWDDARENIMENDRMIYINPVTGELLTGDFNAWMFPYASVSLKGAANPPDKATKGDVLYGLYQNGESDADFPYYIVSYSLGGTAPSQCAPGTRNLIRSERRKVSGGEAAPILNCVLDFQVAFGLDTQKDGVSKIECWEDGGAVRLASYSHEELNTHLKQIRVYALVQQGARDDNYSAPNQIWVGDMLLKDCDGGGIGRYVTLTSEQRKYRWKLVSVSTTPRNISGVY